MVAMRLFRGCCAVLVVAALALSFATGVARAAHYRPQHSRLALRCSRLPPRYDPYDLNQMRASISAGARLAFAIRQRDYLASCRPRAAADR